jgi:hypothetical protein
MVEELDIDNRAEFGTFVSEQTDRCPEKKSRYETSFTCDLRGEYSITENCRTFLKAESERISNILGRFETRIRAAKDLNFRQINQHVDRAQTNADLDATLRTINEERKGPLMTLAVIKELLKPPNKDSALKHEGDRKASDAKALANYNRALDAYKKQNDAYPVARRYYLSKLEQWKNTPSMSRETHYPPPPPEQPIRPTPPGQLSNLGPGQFYKDPDYSRDGGTRRRMKNPSWKGYKLHGTKKTRRGTGHRTRRRNK